ncbi:L-arabinose isomerase [Dyadobacter sandarakinus]|uniref:L-arabinose isomerase n=1 Tax=Dyadobacter sandarakinus TaxID=2747268 RepID=A0ABX7I4L9_9BACT|nr:L-arabinose isomerase [Dyadobacter sandarakinus]QRR01022.1 L-arabinose isomerase [Dyadobacter sandarakinus]
MIDLKQFEVWFVTGSQHLYGEDTLRQVDGHSRTISNFLDQHPDIPVRIVFRPVVKTPDEIYEVLQQASNSSQCIGVIAWMHTFSPAKMWIRGLQALQKPLLHLHTQFNSEIPWSEIDMDFMNLNQSAHGDREFGFMMTRMKLNRKVVVGHWQDTRVVADIDRWVRVAAARHDLKGARIARFGDNMREVAVTEGDKVAAELAFGFSVNTYAVGDLVQVINAVPDNEVAALAAAYGELYALADALKEGGAQHTSLTDAARIELGLRHFLENGNFKGYTNTFEDLHGMKQLPGIGSQRMMAAGFGYAGEGDWKTAAMVRALKVMASGMPGGNSFMEDYTYHFSPGENLVLGAHMLEICPTIARDKPSCEVHPLGIGGKEDPVRLVFNASAGPAINVSLVDLGNRFRLLVNEVEAVEAPHALPKLPVARVLWKPQPDMHTGCAAWIYAGGAHHTVYSQNLSVEHIEMFAEMTGTELVVIDKDTTLRQLKNELRWSEAYYR